mmetsp:Transcript_10167/g.29171  ORF Transcript_10167/g.29171 Transcript_10167/m.29171 type:complete len:435 (-) Transcript_10167:245-1549(-)
MEARVIKQDLGAVAQRELAVAQVLTVLVLVVGVLLGHRVAVAAGKQVLADVHRVVLHHEGRKVGADRHELPLELVEEEVVDHARADRGDVLEEGHEGRVVHGRAGHRRRHHLQARRHHHVRAHRLGGRVRRDVVLDLLQRLDGLGRHRASLRVRHLLLQALHLGQQLGQERLGLAGVVDKLRHVVNDHRNLALDLGLLLLAAAEEDGDSDGERGRVDRLHEDRGRELVHSLSHLVRVLDGADEGRNERLDVAVVNRVAGGLHGVDGRLLHIGLGVPHASGNNGHRLMQNTGESLRVLLGELGDEVQRVGLGLPLRLLGSGKEHTLNHTDSPRAQNVDDGHASRFSSKLDLLLLVRHGLDDRRKEGDQQWLNSTTANFRELGNDNERVGLGRVVRDEALQLVDGTALHKGLRASALDGRCQLISSKLRDVSSGLG